METSVRVWKLTWMGLCDRRAIAATVRELGGWFEGDHWYVPARYKYPVHICHRLAMHFYGGGKCRITLTAA